MAFKSRKEDLWAFNYSNGQAFPIFRVGSYTYEEISYNTNGFKRPWSPCYHWRIKRAPALYWYTDSYYQWMSFGQPDFTRARSYFRSKVTTDIQDPKFEFQKNNNLRLIQLIAELDDTIALFTKKIIRTLLNPFDGQLAIQFGFQQVISDTVSLIHTYYDLRGNIAAELKAAKQSVRVEKIVKHEKEELTPVKKLVQHQYGGTSKYYGVMTIQGNLPEEPNIAIILDELGINDFFNDAWGLVPFSFIIDFFTNSFFPKLISYLTQWMPATWFSPDWQFQGWVMHRIEGKSANMTAAEINLNYSHYVVFDRYYVTTRPENPVPEFKWRTDLGTFDVILGSLLGSFVSKKVGSALNKKTYPQGPRPTKLSPEVKDLLRTFLG